MNIGQAAQHLSKLEASVLIAIVVVFWFPIGGQLIDRADWGWLPMLFLPLVIARLVITRRLLTLTPLTIFATTFLLLAAVNILAAPHTWGWVMLARPVLGVLVVYTLIEYARQNGHTGEIIRTALISSFIIAIISLILTQWNEKSFLLTPITNLLPQPRGIPGLEGGFNANEIAGAICWFIPLMAALAIHRWRENQPRLLVTLTFVLLFVSLMLGQSRMGIFGVLLALALVIYALIPAGRWRRAAWVALALVTLLEIAIIAHPAERERLRDRDENSLAARIAMWHTGLEIIRDYPLTGVGMNMYRARAVREQYPVPGYENRILPHIHNEPLQVAADLGLPGLAVFTGLYGAAAYMLIVCWRRGDGYDRAVSVGVGGGLLAHAVFGMADAIPMSDRFAVVFWFMMGMAAAQYVAVRQRYRPTQT